MAVYIEEGEVWKCSKHPSKRRSNGICPTCLRDRLIPLCPDCANVRPCACCAATSSSSSSSSSSSFSFFSSTSSSRRGGRVSDLIDREPAFPRSRSAGMPFLFTRFAREKQVEKENEKNSPMRKKSRTASFLAKFRLNKSKKRDIVEEKEIENSKQQENCINSNNDGKECRQSCGSASIEEFANLMMRSRSVSVGVGMGIGTMTTGDGARHSSASTKGKRWNIPSPMKVFRHSPKTPKLANDGSTMCRG